MLVSFVGGTGHFLPLVPLARAAATAGDRVLVTGQSAMLPVVASAGFTAADSGGRTLADPAARRPLLPVDRAAESAVITDVFAGRLARTRAARLVEIGRSWRPELVLHDEVDFGAAIAADVLGVPRVELVVLPAGGTIDRDRLMVSLARTGAVYGRPARPGTRRADDRTCPSGFPQPRRPADRPSPADSPSGTRDPVRRSGPGDGSVARLARSVAGPAGAVVHPRHDLPSGVRRSVRPDDDRAGAIGCVRDRLGRSGARPAELGPTPPHVRVERFVPQQFLLARCDLLVCHAGSGSMLGALAFGVPMLLFPMGADQPANADRCVDLGVGTVLDPLTATPGQIAASARTLLTDPRFRTAVEHWRAACAALPTAAEAIRWFPNRS